MKKFIAFLLLTVAAFLGAHADVIHYWRFEEGAGGYTVDEVGGITGDVYGWSGGPWPWSPEVPDPAVPLTGEANNGSIYFGPVWVDITTPQAMNLGTEWTIEYYMNPEQPVIVSPVYAFGGSLGTGTALGDWSGTNMWILSLGGAFGYESAESLTLNEWHHVALVKSPGQYELYIDGLSLGAAPLPASADGPYVLIGSETGDRTIGYGFRGYIDEFRISDTALTPDQFLNAVPEPSSVILLIVGAGLLMRHRIRRRCKT